jgi:hypothetical protein
LLGDYVAKIATQKRAMSGPIAKRLQMKLANRRPHRLTGSEIEMLESRTERENNNCKGAVAKYESWLAAEAVESI